MADGDKISLSTGAYFGECDLGLSNIESLPPSYNSPEYPGSLPEG